jgi:glycerol-3-phosphate acyltransferase PlsY
MMSLSDVAVIISGYLLGSIPFPYLITRWVTGKDIRYVGNGNMGARNVARVVGLAPAVVTVLLDAAKGAGAYWIAARWGAWPWTSYAAGFSALIGHWFPVWLRGRGGVGQAVITGYALAQWPFLIPVVVPIFALARLVVPYFNLAYALAALVGMALILWRGGFLWDVGYVLLLLGCAVAKKQIDAPRQHALLAGVTTPDADRDRPTKPR